nr:PREDICTED: zona pellucida sperm-binding protein 4-like [Latimeria chalumnae]|eukprot:XP_014351266.1 PREDICTED: zona pellucida sperm-binding protein 4-like [Latimeria chalumnae]
MYQLGEVYDALLSIANDRSKDPMTRHEAEAIAEKMLDFQFLCTLAIWHKVLNQINIASKLLQRPDFDLPPTIQVLGDTVTFLQDCRSDEGFQSVIEEAKQLVQVIGIPPEFKQTSWIHPRHKKKQFDYEAEDEPIQDPELDYKVNCFYSILDTAHTSVSERFQQLHEVCQSFHFLYDITGLNNLSATVGVELLKKCKDLQVYLSYGNNADIDALELFDELTTLSRIVESRKSPFEVLQYLAHNNLINTFPNTSIALCILTTIPVSVASGERIFSKLKLIKTYLRSTTSQERSGGYQELSSTLTCGGSVLVKKALDYTITTSYQSCIVGHTEDLAHTMELTLFMGPSTVPYVAKCLAPRDVTAFDVRTLRAGEPTCEVPSGRRVACSGPGTGEVNCKREGCCYTPDDPKMPCYYGNTGCSKNGQFVILVAKEMTRPSLDLNSVYLKGGSGAACRPIGDSLDLLVFKFPVSACGTIKQVEGDSVVYETKVVATRKILQGPRGNITRQSYFRYNGSASEQLQANVLTLAPPLPATDKGDLQIQLRIAKVSQYNSWYLDSDYPVVKFLRDPVFVEVRILGRTDPSIVLMLGDCWATPNGNPQSNIIWNILVNG